MLRLEVALAKSCLLEQQRPIAARRRVHRDAEAGRAAADDEDVPRLLGVEAAGASRRGSFGFPSAAARSTARRQSARRAARSPAGHARLEASLDPPVCGRASAGPGQTPDGEAGEVRGAERGRLEVLRAARRGTPRRSAWICMRRSFARGAAVDAELATAAPGVGLASRSSRSATWKAMPSSAARARWAARRAAREARAIGAARVGSQCGAPRPVKAGTTTTPPESGTRARRAP